MSALKYIFKLIFEYHGETKSKKWENESKVNFTTNSD